MYITPTNIQQHDDTNNKEFLQLDYHYKDFTTRDWPL